jgi:hypothetical protein
MAESMDGVAGRLAAKLERGRSLLMDAVLDAIPEERQAAFDRLWLIEEPLPTAEIKELLAVACVPRPAADVDWLRRRGLLARTVAPSALEGGDAVHRLLVSRRQGALVAREGEEVARAWHLRVAEHVVAPGRAQIPEADAIRGLLDRPNRGSG